MEKWKGKEEGQLLVIPNYVVKTDSCHDDEVLKRYELEEINVKQEK